MGGIAGEEHQADPELLRQQEIHPVQRDPPQVRQDHVAEGDEQRRHVASAILLDNAHIHRIGGISARQQIVLDSLLVLLAGRGHK